ncbi:TetR/AcrR family transcriptional regulator [Tersicoccus sp. MR15.9]|uniref:TetR/AcrR family transcriptional regulator n=1 Tax=Tersicoccus mangrovi TaxID=3121635 RepID=UPI002FE687A3
MASNTPASSGRSARLPREERRRQLLAAAHHVFVTNGYHAAAMDEIAVSAHVSKPVLYQHFPGKHELYLALLDEHLARLTTQLKRALTTAETNRERVRNSIAAYYEFVARDDQAHRLVFESDLLNDTAVAARLEEFQRAYADAVGRVIVEDTDLPLDQAVMLGRTLTGLAQVSARYWVQTGGIDQATAVDLISRLAWRGIGGFQRRADDPTGDETHP